MTSADISVVVPTHNRTAPLARCLAALAAQTAPGLDVVVVDDGSDDPRAVADVVARHAGMRLIRQANAGPAAARNAGVAAARRSIVCLTDDDCEPSPQWAEHLAARLREGADVVAGATVAGCDDAYSRAWQTIADHLAIGFGGDQARLVFATTNNVGCRADTLRSVQFDEDYRHAAGEDRDWCARVALAGFQLEVEPRAVVVHNQDLDLPRFFRQQVRYGRAAHRFRRAAHTPARLESPSYYGRLVRSGFGRGWRTGLLVCVAQVATGVGFALDATSHRSRRLVGGVVSWGAR